MATIVQEDDQKKEFFACGFVRRERQLQNNNDSYPKLLIQTIMTWAGDIFIRINAVHKDFKHLIQNHGTIIKRESLHYQMTSEQYQQHSDPNDLRCLDDVQDRTLVIGSNCFFVNTGIYEWEFKVSGNTFNQDQFGVTDDIDICTKYDEIHFNDIDICRRVKEHLFVIRDSKCEFKKDDKIKVKLNLNENSLSCFTNNTKFGSIEMKPNKAYFPVIVSMSIS